MENEERGPLLLLCLGLGLEMEMEMEMEKLHRSECILTR